MTDSVVVNQNMKISGANIGVLHPPDFIPKPHIYSDYEANKIYNQMQGDLYIAEEKAEKPKKNFPLVLKIIGGLVLITGSAFLFKKPIIKLYNNILNKIKPKT